MLNDYYFYSALIACAKYSGCTANYPKLLDKANVSISWIASLDNWVVNGSNTPSVRIYHLTATPSLIEVEIRPRDKVKSVRVYSDVTKQYTNLAYNPTFGTYKGVPATAVPLGSNLTIFNTATTGEVIRTSMAYYRTPYLSIMNGTNEYWVQIQAAPSNYIKSVYILPHAWMNKTFKGALLKPARWGNSEYVRAMDAEITGYKIPCGTNVDVHITMVNNDIIGGSLVWSVC